MICDQTLPPPRVIEAAIYEDETTEEYTDVACLRLAGSLSSFFRADFGSNAVEQPPLERCRPPIGLYVCREWRRHIVSRYRVMRHTSSRQGCFYFDPCRDLLWLSFDFTDEPEHLRDLQRCYGEQLNIIQTLLVEEEEWTEHTPARYTSQFLMPFSGLETILVLLEDADKDNSEDNRGAIEDESGDSGNDVDGNGGDNDEDSSQGPETEDGELLKRAKELKADYAKFLKDHQATARNIQCLDRSGTYYLPTTEPEGTRSA